MGSEQIGSSSSAHCYRFLRGEGIKDPRHVNARGGRGERGGKWGGGEAGKEAASVCHDLEITYLEYGVC